MNESTTLLLSADTTLGLPIDPHTLEPRWRRTDTGIEATYTPVEFGVALACAGKEEAALRLLENRCTINSHVSKALSIRQPWAWLISNGYKDVENRTWYTRFRGRFYIHASKTWDSRALDWVFERFPRLIGRVSEDKGDYARGGIIGTAILVDCLVKYHSPWFTGPYGLILRGAHPMDFVPLRGQLGLFDCTLENKE